MAEGRPLYITCPELPPLQELISLLQGLRQNQTLSLAWNRVNSS